MIIVQMRCPSAYTSHVKGFSFGNNLSESIPCTYGFVWAFSIFNVGTYTSEEMPSIVQTCLKPLNSIALDLDVNSVSIPNIWGMSRKLVGHYSP